MAPAGPSAAPLPAALVRELNNLLVPILRRLG